MKKRGESEMAPWQCVDNYTLSLSQLFLHSPCMFSPQSQAFFQSCFIPPIPAPPPYPPKRLSAFNTITRFDRETPANSRAKSAYCIEKGFYTEEKAIVVAAVWGTKRIPFLLRIG